MNKEKVEKILASYGGNFKFLPEAEKEALQQLIKDSPELFSLQQQALSLDEQLAKISLYNESLVSVEETNHLAGKILSQVKPQNYHQNKRGAMSFKQWLLELPGYFQTPVLASAVLLIIFALAFFQFNNRAANDMTAQQTQIALENEFGLIEYMLENSPELEVLAFLEPELFDDEWEADVL